MSKPRLDQNKDFKLTKIMEKTVPGKSECRLWTGAIFKGNGRIDSWKYPQIYFQGRKWRGNRLVLFFVTGHEPKDKKALHSCNNSMCLNPDHLYWGTALENKIDSIKAGTAHTKRGRDGKFKAS